MEIVMDNLKTLGFNDGTLSQKSFEVRNVKLFEKIIYFLISAIDSQRIETWPVLSRKDELPFRKEVIEFFKDLDQPSMSAFDVSTLLPNPSGFKCHWFLLTFTKFVLETLIQRSQPQWQKVPLVDLGKTDAIMEKKLMVLAQFHESQILSNFTFYDEEIKKSNSFYQQLMKEHKHLLKERDLANRNSATEKEALLNLEPSLLPGLREDFGQCVSLFSQIDDYNKFIGYTLNKSINHGEKTQALRCGDVHVHVPSTLTAVLNSSQSSMNGFENPLNQSGSINLHSLVALANMSLDEYREEKQTVKEDLLKVNVSELGALIDQINQLTLSVQSQMSVIQSQLNEYS